MQYDRAQTIALQALGWLVANDDLRDVFLGATGGTSDDLRNRAGDRDFQTSVLEFVTMDDAWVVGFCDDTGVDYAEPLRARYILSGDIQ